uniref:FERM domain-containing protein n=1 Tax=Steinernema glaseri TaxID=37863 RepID=A0A1I7YKQ3_9BILA
MNEGKRSKIHLLDGQILDILVQPRLLVSELLNIIASHVNLKDPDIQYFGIAYVDGNENYHWLTRDKRVLDFDFPRKCTNSDEPITLTHTVQFFVKSIFTLEHATTINLHFIDAVNQLTKGLLKLCFSDYTAVYANLLQYYAGDFESEQSALELVQKAVPKDITFFRTYDKAANDCDQEILKWYRALSGISAGQALINVMTRLEKSVTYGMRLYSVRDKGSTNWSLGINTRGISQYDPSDLLNAKKDFPWDSLEKIYYRDRKFTIEIRDARRAVDSSERLSGLLDGMEECDDDLLAEAVNHPTTQVSLSRRAVQPSSSLHVYVFYCASALLCESLWSAATDQHQFYLDQTTTSSSQASRKQKVDGVIRDLTVKRQRANSQSSFGSSLPSLSSLASCASSLGMPAAKVADGSSTSLPSVQSTYNQMTDEERKLMVEKYKALKAKKDELEDKLLEKLDELRSVCIHEGEITGEMPKEIYRTLVPGEPEPKLKRRIGTAFKISPELLSQCSKTDKLDQMAADVELHRKIVAAAERLAKDKSMNKSVRKKRRKELEAASQKLKGLELGLNQLRLSSSKPDVSTAGIAAPGSAGVRAWPNFPGHPCSTKGGGSLVAKSCPTTPRGSIPDLYAENDFCERDEQDGTRSSSVSTRVQSQRLSPRNLHGGSTVLPPMVPGRRPTIPSVKVSTNSVASDELDNPLNVRSPSLQGFENVGYQSSAPYKSSYRQSNFPTLQNTNRFLRAQSEHSLRQDSPPTSLPGERQNDPRPNNHSRTSGLRLYDASCNPTSWSAPSGVQVNSEARSSGDTADDRLSRWASRMPNYEARRTERINSPQTAVSQMSTSHSFSGTFATSSLDRRALKIRQNSASQLPSTSVLHSSADLRRDANGLRVEASSKTTTFPVTQNGSIKESYNSLDKPDVMRYHSSTLSSSKTVTCKPPPPSYSSRFCDSSTTNISIPRIPGATDPHMEALLHYYKDAANDNARKSSKTATIV